MYNCVWKAHNNLLIFIITNVQIEILKKSQKANLSRKICKRYLLHENLFLKPYFSYLFCFPTNAE